jgi:type II secretion system protein J
MIVRLQRRGGFTLLEIIVSIGLLALIVSAIYSTWYSVTRGAQAGKSAAAAAQRTRVAIHALETALSSTRSFDADIKYYSFIGENGAEAKLSFVSWLPENFFRHQKFDGFPVRRVTFSLEAGPGFSKQLVMRQNPILRDMDPQEQSDPILLASNVKDFVLSFSDGKSAEPLDEWLQTNMLPKTVTFTLRLGGNDPNSRIVEQEITREVALPSVSVQRGWQMPGGVGGANGAGGAGGPQINPGGGH